MQGELRPAMEAFAQMVRAHGFGTARRAVQYLASVAIVLRSGEVDFEGPGYVIEKVAGYWGVPLRTTEREAQSWRQVTDGADVFEVARQVLGALDEAGTDDVEVTGLRLAGFVPIV